jgi:hypothetical protein
MEICICDATLSFRLGISLKSEHAVRICVTLATKVTIDLVRQKQTVQFIVAYRVSLCSHSVLVELNI